MRIDDMDERYFYEIEAARNNWSLSELGRQLDSALYERLALSRNEEDARRMTQGVHRVETARDLVKDPFVLEFLGLPEQSAYSERELVASL